MDQHLSHTDANRKARMVDVSAKPITARRAIAEGFVLINQDLAKAINANTLAKGNVLDVARLAGIQAAKRTSELIPLCHNLPLDAVHIDVQLQPGRVRIQAEVSAHGRTGVEMEALTAVAVAALVIIDMGKAIDKTMVVEAVRILEKHGGRSGSFLAGPAAETLT